MKPLADFATKAKRYANGMKSRHAHERLLWPSVLCYLECAWLAGYSFGLKETTDMFRPPCKSKKRKV